MKKSLFGLLSCLSLCLVFTGCIKDECKNTYKIYTPVYKTVSQVRTEMKTVAPQQLRQTGKIYMFGQYIFLNELNKGIHVINNSIPAAPQKISFINIPGNVDLAVKDNYLYADSYNDVVVFDITNPLNAITKKFINNIFPNKGANYSPGNNHPDSVRILVDYIARDTTVDCDTYRVWERCAACSMSGNGGGQFLTSAPAMGTGGSMARFALVNNYLYGVSQSDLYSFKVTDAANPQLQNKKSIGWNIETVYPFQDKLFIGSTTGMFIYNISNPADPALLGRFAHGRSCDPVITDGQYAYVTLRSGTECQTFTNQLDVLDVSNATSPVLKKTYSMTNPHGLSKDGSLLFICDGKAGLKIYDATDAQNIQLKKTIGDIETYDVILQNKIAFVVAKSGLYQYDYSNANNIRLISTIAISK